MEDPTGNQPTNKRTKRKMGTKLAITKEDVNATKLITGWVLCDIVEYKEEPAKQTAKNPGSLNRNISFRVAEGEHEGVKLRTTFNEVFSPLMPEYVNSIGGEYAEGKVYDLEESVGRKIRVHIRRGEYNGRPTNEVDGFRPAA